MCKEMLSAWLKKSTNEINTTIRTTRHEACVFSAVCPLVIYTLRTWLKETCRNTSEDLVSPITTNYFAIVRMTIDWQGRKPGQINANNIQALFTCCYMSACLVFPSGVPVYLRVLLASCGMLMCWENEVIHVPSSNRNKPAQTEPRPGSSQQLLLVADAWGQEVALWWHRICDHYHEFNIWI